MAGLSARSPLGFAVIDVDYYSSAKDCLNVFLAEADKYLPWTLVYLDDIGLNLKPARALGMSTIKVDDIDVALRELSGLVGFALTVDRA